jgi:hypothetical protein
VHAHPRKPRSASNDLLLIILLVGVGSLWFFGRTQPIEISQTTVTDKSSGTCATCGGAGSVESMEDCTACGGSGKGEWKLKGRAVNQSDANRPPCMTCGGRGKTLQRKTCTSCNGTGASSSATTRTVKAARAGLSLWERILNYVFIKPDPNPAPQVNATGGYALVETHVSLQAGGRPARVRGYGSWQRAGADWRNVGLVEYGAPGADNPIQTVEFTVRNREVVSMRTLR